MSLLATSLIVRIMKICVRFWCTVRNLYCIIHLLVKKKTNPNEQAAIGVHLHFCRWSYTVVSR